MIPRKRAALQISKNITHDDCCRGYKTAFFSELSSNSLSSLKDELQVEGLLA